MAESESSQEIHATPEQIVKLWEQTNLYPAEWVGDANATPSGPSNVRAAIPFRLASAVVGEDAGWQEVMTRATDACVRLLVSRDAGRTYLDVSPDAMRVLVAEDRAFAETGTGERRAFRVRRHRTEGADDQGPMRLHSAFVEVSEEEDEGQCVRPKRVRTRRSDDADRPHAVGRAPTTSQGSDQGHRHGVVSANPSAFKNAIAAKKEPGVRVVPLYGLQFDPVKPSLAEELVEELSADEHIQVGPRHAHLLPPGLYFIFHERDETGETDSGNGWIAELALRPISAEGERSAHWITLDNLILKYQRWAADNKLSQT